MSLKSLFAIALLVGPLSVVQAAPTQNEVQTAIVDLKIAKDLQIPVLYEQGEHKLAVAKLNNSDRMKLSEFMHKNGRCGGYEVVDVPVKSNFGPFQLTEQSALESLFKNMPSRQMQLQSLVAGKTPQFDKNVLDKVNMVSESNLMESVKWMSSYPTRHHASATKNDHVSELKTRLTAMAAKVSFPVQIEFVGHNRTSQNSLRARIVGSERPNEIVVLGAHFDSINQSYFGNKEAPGADDDASGSANLVEIYRILLTGQQPKRTIEFFWYAAEEVGLYGSSEIATNYKAESKNVVGVMQLDMTLYPGDGEFKIVFMTDFTSPELTQYVVDLNNLYVKAQVLFDKCGYGCSDHASWHRQGYPAIMPFEATFNGMNRNIHTVNDVIDSKSSFKHSAGFAKLGVAYAMTLANESI